MGEQVPLTETKYQSGFDVIECNNCCLPFGVTAYFDSRRREDHKTFYCPSGHPNYYPSETDNEKLQRKAEVLADQVRMEREQREKLQRQLNRIQKGTCPKCNRHFVDVERHMKTQHKEHK